MSLEEVKGKVESHDRSLEMVAMAIEDLAATAGATNVKLDKVVEAMSTHNVLVERFNNMDRMLTDSFQRRDDRLKHLESVQQTTGCAPLKVSDENIRSLGRSVDTLRDAMEKGFRRDEGRIDAVDTRMGTFVSGVVVRWAIGIMITILIVVTAVNRDMQAEIREQLGALGVRLSTIDSRTASQDLVLRQSLNTTEERVKELQDDEDACEKDVNSLRLEFRGRHEFETR